MAKMPDGILDIVKAKMRFETEYLTDFKQFSSVYPDRVEGVRKKRCFRDRIFIDLRCFEEECPYLEYKNEAECICTFFKKEKSIPRKIKGLVIEDAVNDLMQECYFKGNTPEYIFLSPSTFDAFIDHLKTHSRYRLENTKHYGQQVMYGGLIIYIGMKIPRNEVQLFTDKSKMYVKKIEIPYYDKGNHSLHR